MQRFLSKSKYLAGLQCPRLLWYYYNSPDDIPEVDEATQAIFDAGHAVGDLAKRLYPDGVEVPFTDGIESTVSATAELLPRRIPLFEASFLADTAYCRVDILVPSGDNAWDLIEVKSSTSVKDVNLHDVAFQASCVESAGLKLDRLQLMHVDRSYVRDGEIVPSELLCAEDVTADARSLMAAVPDAVARLLAVVDGPEPECSIGPQCTSPYKCVLKDLCWGFLPEDPVTELHRMRTKKKVRLISEGICALTEVPPHELSDKQLIQQHAVASGKPHIDAGEIRNWIAQLEYPLYCLDFETIAPVVPLHDGTRPRQKVPFQLSLHIRRTPGEACEHVEYLATDTADPRPGLISALKAIGPKGTVLAYNMSFEKGVLSGLAEAFPEHAEFLEDLRERLLDLGTPFQKFWFYHPAQKGSWSLKKVLPALTDQSYDDLAIGDGMKASREFLRVVHGDVAAEEKQQTLWQLREYCKQDTAVMLDVLDELDGMA